MGVTWNDVFILDLLWILCHLIRIFHVIWWGNLECMLFLEGTCVAPVPYISRDIMVEKCVETVEPTYVSERKRFEYRRWWLWKSFPFQSRAVEIVVRLTVCKILCRLCEWSRDYNSEQLLGSIVKFRQLETWVMCYIVDVELLWRLSFVVHSTLSCHADDFEIPYGHRQLAHTHSSLVVVMLFDCLCELDYLSLRTTTNVNFC